MLIQLTGGWPLASPVPHARPICAQTCVGQRQCAAQSSVFLEALYVFLRSVSKDSETVSDVREYQCVDQRRQ